MAAHQTGPLPNEIWIRVLQNLDNDDDIAELWTICRHVCTAFKEVTESIFRERHLPRTGFDFNLGERVYLLQLFALTIAIRRVPECSTSNVLHTYRGLRVFRAIRGWAHCYLSTPR